MGKALTAARVNIIAERQFPTRYGSDYKPSILATAAEAPAISRPSIRYSSLLGRDTHSLSISELKALVLAIRHPNLIELHENAAYNHGPGPHPFADHPLACTSRMPTTSGTLALALAAGVLSAHPVAREESEADLNEETVAIASSDEVADDGDPSLALGFWIGDLRLLMHDDQGLYTLDWDIKAVPGDHGKPGPGRTSSRSMRRAEARAKVIRAFNAELGIRLINVSGAEIDDQLFRNLVQLMAWHHRTIDRPEPEIAALEQHLKEAMGTRATPLNVLQAWLVRGWRREEFLTALYQAIWFRRVRVDLFEPLNVDRPLLPEERCPFDVYSHLFSR